MVKGLEHQPFALEWLVGNGTIITTKKGKSTLPIREIHQAYSHGLVENGVIFWKGICYWRYTHFSWLCEAMYYRGNTSKLPHPLSQWFSCFAHAKRRRRNGTADDLTIIPIKKMGHSPNTTGEFTGFLKHQQVGKGIWSGYGHQPSPSQSVRSSSVAFWVTLLSVPRLRTFLAQRNDTSSLAKKMKNPSKAMSCPSWKGYRLLALNREKKRQNSTLVIQIWNPKTNHLEPWHWLINQHPIKWTLLKFTSTWNPQDPPIWKKGWPFS